MRLRVRQTNSRNSPMMVSSNLSLYIIFTNSYRLTLAALTSCQVALTESKSATSCFSSFVRRGERRHSSPAGISPSSDDASSPDAPGEVDRAGLSLRLSARRWTLSPFALRLFFNSIMARDASVVTLVCFLLFRAGVSSSSSSSSFPVILYIASSCAASLYFWISS